MMLLSFPGTTASFILRRKRLPVTRLVLWLSFWSGMFPSWDNVFVFHSRFLVFYKDEEKKEKCDEELLLISVETVAGTVSGW